MGRDKDAPLNDTQKVNLDKLLIQINKIRSAYGKSMTVSSGYRPASINNAVKGAAKNSSHLTCEAVDIQDLDGSLFKWVLLNIKLIEQCGLYIEDKRWTKTWVHFQTRPTKARIFKAYATEPPNPELWDGKY